LAQPSVSLAPRLLGRPLAVLCGYDFRAPARLSAALRPPCFLSRSHPAPGGGTNLPLGHRAVGTGGGFGAVTVQQLA